MSGGLSDEQLNRLDELGGKDELTEAEMAELQDLEELADPPEEIDPNVAPSVQGFSVEDVSADVAKQKDAAELATINNAFRASQETTEDDAATTAAISTQLKVPFDTVRANLPAFRKSAAAANFDADKWRKENPQLAKVLIKHPELGDTVMSSKELGPIVTAINEATDWVKDTLRASVGNESDAARGSRALRDSMKSGSAEPLKETTGALKGEAEQRTAARAKRDAPQRVLEKDDALAKIAREKTGLDYANMVAWQRGIETWKSLNIARLYSQLMFAENGGPGDVADLRKEIADAELDAAPRAYGDNSGIVRDLSIGVQGGVSTLQVVGSSLKGGGAAGVVGGVAGGIVGGVATRTPQGAMAGAGVGMRFLAPKGAQVGAAWATFQLEAGSQYKQSLELVTDQGQKLTPGEAAGGAIAVGIINSGLEMVSFGQQTKVLKGALPSQITGLIKKDPTFRRLLADLSREWFKSVATEGITEGVQNAVGQVAEYVQATLKDSSARKALSPQQERIQAELLAARGGPRPVLEMQQVIADVEAGALGAVGMGAGSTMTSLALTQTADAKAELDDRQVTPLLQLAQQPAVQAAPQVFAEMIEETSRENGGKPLRSLHVDAHAIVTYFQNEGKTGAEANEEISQLVGEDAPARLLEAAATGGKLEVPMSKVMGAWGNSEIGQALAQDTTTDPTAPTLRQRGEQKAEIDARTQALVEEEIARFEDEQHTDRLVDEYVQSIVESGRDSKEAKAAGAAMMRTFLETAARDENKRVSELFPEVPILFHPGDEEGTASQPVADELLDEDTSVVADTPEPTIEDFAAGLTEEQRAEMMFRDDVTGLPTRRAWDATPRTPGTVVGVVTVPDVKGINDAPKGGHEVTNRLLRQIGVALDKLMPDRMVVRNGTDFLVEANGQAELDAIVAQVQAQAPENVRVLGFTGSDVKAAYAAEKSGTSELRKLPEGDARRVLERGKTAFPVEKLTDDAFPGEPSQRPTPQLKPLEGEAFLKEVLQDRQMPGVLSRHGFNNSPARPFAASIDMRGLKKINEWAKELAEQGKREGDVDAPGDAILAAFGDAAMRSGGRRVFFAHMSGDEFAAKGHSRQELELFIKRFDAELQRIGIPVTLKDGTRLELVPKFRHGIAEGSYGKADQQLNTSKAAEPVVEPLDPAGELRRAGILQRAPGVDRQAGVAPTERGVTGGSEGAAGVLREGDQTQPAEGGSVERSDEQVPGWVTENDLGPPDVAQSDVTEEDALIEKLSAHHELRQEEEEAIRAGFNRPEALALAREAIARFRATIPEGEKKESAERAARRKKAALKKRDDRRAAALAFLKWIEGTGPRVSAKGDVFGGKDSVKLEAELYKQTIAWGRKLNLIDPSNGMTTFWASQPKGLDPSMNRGKYTPSLTPRDRAIKDEQRKAFAKNVLGRLQQADPQKLDAALSAFADEFLTALPDGTPEATDARTNGGGEYNHHEMTWLEAKSAMREARQVRSIINTLKRELEKYGPHAQVHHLLRQARQHAEIAAEAEVVARAMIAGKSHSAALDLIWEATGPERLKLSRSQPTFGLLLRDVEDRMNGISGRERLLQLPTPEESAQRLKEHLVLLDALRDAGAREVGTPAKFEMLIEQIEREVRAEKLLLRSGPGGSASNEVTARAAVRHAIRQTFGKVYRGRRQGPNFGLYMQTAGTAGAKEAGLTKQMTRELEAHALVIAQAYERLRVGRTSLVRRINMDRQEVPASREEMSNLFGGDATFSSATGSAMYEAERFGQPAPVRGGRSGGSRTHGAPLSNLTLLYDGGKPVEGGLYPADVYSANGRRFYGDPGTVGDQQNWKIINEARGKPDKVIEVFAVRGENEDRDLEPGDLVNLSREYAEDQLRGAREEVRAAGMDDASIPELVTFKVRAGDLFADGNFSMEWGYDPLRAPPTPVKQRELGEPWFQNEEDSAAGAAPAPKKGPKGYVWAGMRALQSTINAFLNKHADFSTVVHESAHGFLEQMLDIGERPDASERSRQKYQQVLEALGVSKRSEIKREHHEKFVRQYEAWLAEGKMPTKQLARLFRNFSNWLLRIYKAVRSIPEFDPVALERLRPVFEAMHATEQAIAAARRAEGPKQEQTEDQKEVELDEYAEATYDAQLRAVKDALRRHEAWWKKGVAKLQKAIADEYDGLPATRALNLLRGDQGVELSDADVKAVLGDQKLKGVKVGENGASPGLVAELSGFPSGEAMLRAIVDHPSKDRWVELEANREMERLNPAIYQRKEEFQRLVQGGLHKATQKRLEREWSGLPRDAMQRAARGMVASRPLDSLNPRQALAQMRRAANEKARAAAAGDIQAAGDAARVELLNHFLHGELVKAQDEMQAGLEIVGKLSKTSARERLGKAAPAYRDAVEFIRGAVFGAPTAGDASVITQAIAQLNGDGVLIGDPDWLKPLQAALARVDSYQDMTVGEFRSVVDALKMINAGAIARTQMLVDGRKLYFEEVKAAVLAEIESTLPSRGPVKEKYQQNALERLGGLANAFDGFLLAVPDLVKDLTGDNPNSMLHKVFVNTLRRAQTLETDLLEQRIQPIISKLEEMPKNMRKRLGDPIDGAALFPNHRKDLSPPRKRFELLMLALNSGNEGNLQVLLEGRGIAREELTKALNLLTKEEIGWVNEVLESLEQLREPAFALEERVTGLRPEAVEAVPMTLTNGILKGGYFPLKAVPELSRAGAMQFGDDQLASVLDPTFSRPTTRHGHLKARTGATYAVSLDPDVIRKHLLQVAHDIAFREAVRDAAKLVMDQDVRGKLIEHLGAGKASEFLKVLKDIGGARGYQANDGEIVLRFLKTNLATSALSGLSTAIGNLATFPAAVATGVSAKHLAAATFTLSPSMRREALAKSGIMRTNASKLVEELKQATSDWTRHPVLKGHDHLREAGMAAMRAIDTLTGTAVWTAAYRQALASKKEEGEAVRFADDMLLRVLPSMSTLERAGILRDPGWLGALAMFYSYLSVARRQEHRILAPLFTRAFKQKSLAQKAVTVGKVAGGLLAFYIAVQVLGELGMGRGPEAGDEDEDDPEDKRLKWRNWFVRKVAGAPLNLIPIVPLGSMFDSAVLKKRAPSPRSDPASAALSSIYEAGMELTTGDDPKKSRTAAMRVIGNLTGAPTRLVDTTGGYLFDVATGEVVPRNPADFASGVLYGRRENQPANVFTLAEDLWTWLVDE